MTGEDYQEVALVGAWHSPGHCVAAQNSSTLAQNLTELLDRRC